MQSVLPILVNVGTMLLYQFVYKNRLIVEYVDLYVLKLFVSFNLCFTLRLAEHFIISTESYLRYFLAVYVFCL
jgi:hypothetical protein